MYFRGEVTFTIFVFSYQKKSVSMIKIKEHSEHFSLKIVTTHNERKAIPKQF